MPPSNWSSSIPTTFLRSLEDSRVDATHRLRQETSLHSTKLRHGHATHTFLQLKSDSPSGNLARGLAGATQGRIDAFLQVRKGRSCYLPLYSEQHMSSRPTYILPIPSLSPTSPCNSLCSSIKGDTSPDIDGMARQNTSINPISESSGQGTHPSVQAKLNRSRRYRHNNTGQRGHVTNVETGPQTAIKDRIRPNGAPLQHAIGGVVTIQHDDQTPKLDCSRPQISSSHRHPRGVRKDKSNGTHQRAVLDPSLKPIDLVAKWEADLSGKQAKAYRGRGRGRGRGRNIGHEGRHALAEADVTPCTPDWIVLNDGNSSSDSQEPGFTVYKTPPKVKEELKNLGMELCNWDGTWAPAPLDWDSRPAFRDHQSEDRIWEWLDREVRSLGLPAERLIKVLPGHEHDVAPAGWIPCSNSHQRHRMWSDLLSLDHPAPVDQDDLKDAVPFWNCYENVRDNSLLPCRHPLIAGPSPEETLAERRSREADLGNLSRMFKPHKAHQTRGHKSARPKETVDVECAREVVAREIKTTLDMFIRRAHLPDLRAITTIYNHGITATAAPPSARRTFRTMTELYQIVSNCGLPFLVAVERGKAPSSETSSVDEEVVGIAFADPRGRTDEECNDIEVQIMTRHDRTRRHIAKCLLDRLVECLDKTYTRCPGYEVEENVRDPDTYNTDVSAMKVSLPFARQGDLQSFKTWLVDLMGFEDKGSDEDKKGKLPDGIKIARFERQIGSRDKH